MPSYTQDFRDEVIARVISSNEPVSHIAAKYGVAKCTVYSWMMAYRYNLESVPNVMLDSMTESDIPLDTPREERDFKRLFLDAEKRLEQSKQKIHALEGEVDFLKKVSRYFAHIDPSTNQFTQVSPTSFRSTVPAFDRNYVSYAGNLSSELLPS